MKQFTIPFTYRSPVIAAIKKRRKGEDKLKKDFSPSVLDLGKLKIYLARHFGFCYGVENAIEIAFKTINENPGRRIFLLSEMIHNPKVNEDLYSQGVRFLQDTNGLQLIPFESLTSEDIVLIPAFGTTLHIEKQLKDIGIEVAKYNTTCPFVEKVWNRSEQIARKHYSIIVHGKPTHEETRATFSHAAKNAPTLIIKDLNEAKMLAPYLEKKKDAESFYREFEGRYSTGFNPMKDLDRIGVVNQTTMLATETQAIADYLKSVMVNHYHLPSVKAEERFADTRDTLCYATHDNQSAVNGLLDQDADLAIVVGGYKSSNTSHLVELCEERLPTYFIDNALRIGPQNKISHFNFHLKQEFVTENFMPDKEIISILIASGASCPDAIVEEVIRKLASQYQLTEKLEEVVATLLDS